MNVRVTQSAASRSALASLRRASSGLAATQEQVVTGRRINRPSDAPQDAAHAYRLQVTQARIERYTRNLEQAQSEIEYAASAVQEFSDVLIQAREACIEGANATTSASDRLSLAYSVDQLLQGAVSRANTEFNGKYIFAGTDTDTRPFESEAGSSGYVEHVVYQGNDGRLLVDVGPRTRVQTNEPGPDAFGAPGTEGSVFDALIELRDLLRNDAGQSDHQVSLALSDHLDVLAAAQETVLDATARLGWRSSQLESTRTALANAGLANSQLLGELEDADLAGAAARLYSQESALEAAMVVAARMLRNSVLDYLR